MEFEGGTYISQVKAPSEKTACQNWAENLEVSGIVGFREKSREILIKKIASEDITPVENVQNAWCVSALIRGRSILTTFVKTEILNNANPKSEIQNPKSN